MGFQKALPPLSKEDFIKIFDKAKSLNEGLSDYDIIKNIVVATDTRKTSLDFIKGLFGIKKEVKKLWED